MVAQARIQGDILERGVLGQDLVDRLGATLLGDRRGIVVALATQPRLHEAVGRLGLVPQEDGAGEHDEDGRAGCELTRQQRWRGDAATLGEENEWLDKPGR